MNLLIGVTLSRDLEHPIRMVLIWCEFVELGHELIRQLYIS